MKPLYAEAAYFDGHPCKHVADYEESLRLKRLAKKCKMWGGRDGGRKGELNPRHKETLG